MNVLRFLKERVEPLIKEEIVEMLEFLPQEYSQELVVGQLGSFHFDKAQFAFEDRCVSSSCLMTHGC